MERERLLKEKEARLAANEEKPSEAKNSVSLDRSPEGVPARDELVAEPPLVDLAAESPVQLTPDVEAPEKKTVFRRVMSAVSTVVTVLLIAVTAFLVVMMLTTKGNTAGANVFGYRMYSVLSGSMMPEINPGDVVLVKEVPPEEIHVRDVITFYRPDEDGQRVYVTHRVMAITEVGVGTPAYVTRGDASQTDDEKPVIYPLVMGKMVVTLPWLGKIIDFTRNGLGLLVIILPAFIIIVVEVIKLIRMARKPDDKEAEQDSKGA